MPKADAAVIAASVKKSNADAAAMGTTEFVEAMANAAVKKIVAEMHQGGPARGSLAARTIVERNFGKKRHRRGWCTL